MTAKMRNKQLSQTLLNSLATDLRSKLPASLKRNISEGSIPLAIRQEESFKKGEDLPASTTWHDKLIVIDGASVPSQLASKIKSGKIRYISVKAEKIEVGDLVIRVFAKPESVSELKAA